MKGLSKLNDNQHEAVVTANGPVLVLAGAGTGKTRVITYRIAFMIYNGVPPENILAVTFTNKAADEMRERTAKLIGKRKSENIFISTFHSLCLHILRESIDELGFRKDFTICDASDQASLIRKSLREVSVGENNFNPQMVLSSISNLKNNNIDPDDMKDEIGDDYEDAVALSFKRYQDTLKLQNQLDFDDLLLMTLKLFKTNKKVLLKYQKRFRFIMIDEYQDTNHVQYEIMRLLSSKLGNICVVGDDDQSIYGWRGADISNILDFHKHFKKTKMITLDCNYRSTSNVLEVANHIIVNNTKRHDKKLRSHIGKGDKVKLMVASDPEEEAQRIVNNIAICKEKLKDNYGDHAILFRTNAQSRAFEEALRDAAIPYVLIGGMKFFDRKEIRDIMSYLKIITNPNDEVSLLRIINYPTRGIGKGTIEALNKVSAQYKCSMFNSMEKHCPKDIPPAAQNGVRDLVAIVREYQRLFKKNKLEPTLIDLLEKLEISKTIKNTAENPTEANRRAANVAELISAMGAYADKNKKATLAGFLERITLANENEDSNTPGKNAVTLITLHSCKGMEFPKVYLTGIEEKILPHERSMSEGREIDEERRLAYVGVTRAQKQLLISYCLIRKKFGKDVMTAPSRFLSEIPQDLIQPIPLTRNAQVLQLKVEQHRVKMAEEQNTKSKKKTAAKKKGKSEKK